MLTMELKKYVGSPTICTGLLSPGFASARFRRASPGVREMPYYYMGIGLEMHS